MRQKVEHLRKTIVLQEINSSKMVRTEIFNVEIVKYNSPLLQCFGSNDHLQCLMMAVKNVLYEHRRTSYCQDFSVNFCKQNLY